MRLAPPESNPRPEIRLVAGFQSILWTGRRTGGSTIGRTCCEAVGGSWLMLELSRKGVGELVEFGDDEGVTGPGRGPRFGRPGRSRLLPVSPQST